MSERLRDRLIEAITEWNNEFGEGENISVTAEAVLSATVETLADFLLSFDDEALRIDISSRVHVYLDMCLSGDRHAFRLVQPRSSH